MGGVVKFFYKGNFFSAGEAGRNIAKNSRLAANHSKNMFLEAPESEYREKAEFIAFWNFGTTPIFSKFWDHGGGGVVNGKFWDHGGVLSTKTHPRINYFLISRDRFLKTMTIF